ncbi:MAG: hypothetical protein A3K10_03565, partial [Bacteroidetes bacterium RIFCSPLOWO2_12_FULL_31_6]
MSKKTNQLIVHLLGCAIFLALPIIFSPDLSTDFDFIHAKGFQRDLLFSIFLIPYFYLSYFLLIPKLYFTKKYALFASSAFVCFLLIFCLPLILIPSTNFNSNSFDAFFIRELKIRLFQFLIVFVFSLMLKINIRLKQSEKEKLDAELAYLKAQINPHFLFNTLNSIYSLAIVKSDNVASSIVKLSNMMRYVLSESSNDFVRLEKEIEYIQNFIELQQIRFGSFIQFECTITGDHKNKFISPLILIPFIENAYKHGVNAEDNSIIKIKIDTTENQLFLFVKNNKVFIQRSEES